MLGVVIGGISFIIQHQCDSFANARASLEGEGEGIIVIIVNAVYPGGGE